MAELQDLVGFDLGHYRILPFYEIQTSNDDRGVDRVAKPECYRSEALATFRAKGINYFGSNGEVVQVYVIVAEEADHGVALTGLNATKMVALCNDEEATLTAAREILARLSPEERAILGYTDD